MPSGPLCHFKYNNLRSIRLSPRFFFLLGPKGGRGFFPVPKVGWAHALEGRGVALGCNSSPGSVVLGCESMAAPLLAMCEVGITTARVLVVAPLLSTCEVGITTARSKYRSRSGTWTLRRPAILHRHLPYHTIPWGTFGTWHIPIVYYPASPWLIQLRAFTDLYHTIRTYAMLSVPCPRFFYLFIAITVKHYRLCPGSCLRI